MRVMISKLSGRISRYGTLASLLLCSFLLGGCAGYEFPRTDSGRIDEDALKEEIDIPISDKCRFDTENQEILCQCQIKKLWCV